MLRYNELYDSDNPDSIPSGVWAAGYCDGYAANVWNTKGWVRFPNAKRIAVFATTNDGDVGDVERGDMLPWELPDWVIRARGRGEDPWGYVNMSNWAPTRTEFQLRGIPEPHWWVALYDNDPTIPPGAIAKQYANSTLTGKHYDLSVVNPLFGPSQGSLEQDMDTYFRGPDGSIYNVGAAGKRHVGPLEWAVLVAVGRSFADVDAATIASIPDLAGSGAEVEPKAVTGTFTGTLS